MVEQGCAPLESASFWLTMARMRPLVGSIATTVPFMLPSASMSGLPHHGIFAGGDVSLGDILGKRTGGEALVITVAAGMNYSHRPRMNHAPTAS